MFGYWGNFNNPFNNWFMPSCSFNFFMPNMYMMSRAFVNPVIPLLVAMNQFSSPQITYPAAHNYQNRDNTSIFTPHKKTAVTQRTPQPRASETTQTHQTQTHRAQTVAATSSSRRAESTAAQPGVKTKRTVRTRVSTSQVKKQLGPEFLKRVKEVAKNLNCNYKDLLAVMNAESGLNPKAVNKYTGATGLIQIMPTTAQQLGTTKEEIKNMSAIDQLDYVEKYLAQCKQWAGFKAKDKLKSSDLYALILLPARANREVLTNKGEKYYTQNKGLDINNDSRITKSELAQRVANFRVNESIFA